MSNFDSVVIQHGPPGGMPHQGGMVVMTQPANQGLIVSTIEGHREWTTGLFDCFSDMKSCLFGWCCLPCLLCSLSSRQGDCLLMPCCVESALLTMRTRIRTLGGIRGSICNDCLVAVCCPQCAACQLQREMDNMGL